MRLGDGEIVLRPAELSDAERVRRWVNDPQVARGVGRALPVGEAEHARYWRALLGGDEAVVYAIERRGEHVGNVWLWAVDRQHGKAEVRILVGEPSARGQGVGRRAIELVAGHAGQGLQIGRLYAFVIAGNRPAERAFAKAGFAEEGRLRADRWVDGAYRDVVVFGRNAPGREASPF